MEEKTIPQSRAARQLPMHKGAAPCKKPSANGFPQTSLHFALCLLHECLPLEGKGGQIIISSATPKKE